MQWSQTISFCVLKMIMLHALIRNRIGWQKIMNEFNKKISSAYLIFITNLLVHLSTRPSLHGKYHIRKSITFSRWNNHTESRSVCFWQQDICQCQTGVTKHIKCTKCYMSSKVCYRWRTSKFNQDNRSSFFKITSGLFYISLFFSAKNPVCSRFLVYCNSEKIFINLW